MLTRLSTNRNKVLISCRSMTTINSILIDLSGTLHVGEQPTPNAVSALKRLRETKIPIRFLTNTTKESVNSLYNNLKQIGFELKVEEIYSSLTAARQYLTRHNLKNPFYILSDDARNDFPKPNPEAEYDSVVIGLAPDQFNYEYMNIAFNILFKGNPLIAIHQGRYYKTKEGLAIGPGCVVKGLEYCAGTNSILIGKPNALFFKSALAEGIDPSTCIMIGDDPKDDIVGAMNVGMKGFLVKTGKYIEKENEPKPYATEIFNTFADAVEWIVESIEKSQ